jgi:hypothetical protein
MMYLNKGSAAFVVLLSVLHMPAAVNNEHQEGLITFLKSIWAHYKKRGVFSSVFLSFFLPLLKFVYRVFGRFATRGVQKRD